MSSNPAWWHELLPSPQAGLFMSGVCCTGASMQTEVQQAETDLTTEVDGVVAELLIAMSIGPTPIQWPAGKLCILTNTPLIQPSSH